MKMKPILIVATPIVALTLIACGSGGNDNKATQGPGAQDQPTTALGSSPASGKKTIVMTVTGPAKASITYGLDGDTSQDTDADLPWKKTLHGDGGMMSFASVSAQNSASGTLKCTITVNGKVVKENSSTGQYAIADCNATGW